MDEEPRQAEPDVTRGERSPEQIQAEIEATREQLGDTVAAVGQKADIKGQARGKVNELKQTAQARKDELLTKTRSNSPDSVSAGAQQIKGKAQDNPMPIAVGGALLVGFLLGRRAGR
ncbi:MAG: hypothetical protein QOK21_2856 [Solirubrobacteraceae bacterium]|jgi:ElaB/YqjD/DUF883 family membrane-anchored ribosome-binding protein|nr:hypothetical protein [Solirubrobacteraceae bacterium]